MSEITPAADTLVLERGTFLPNIFSNGLYFALSITIGLWFTPYLIRHLGTSVYGLIPLATNLMAYLAVLTFSLNVSVGRYLTIALEQNDAEEANRIFNTSFFGSALLVLLFVPVFVLVSLYADKLIIVPPGYEDDTRLFFAFISVVFILNATRSPFGASAFSRNRFDLTNLLESVYTLLRVGSVAAIFFLLAPKIWHVGLATVLATTFAFAGSVWICRRLTPGLRLSWRHHDWKTFKHLAGTSGWVVLGQVGGILFFSIDLLVVNRILGAETSGRYAVVLQWSVLLRTFAAALTGVFGPTIMAHYAKNDINALVAYAQRAVKFIGLALALAIGLVVGFSERLLLVWLDPSFTDLAPLMVLMIGPLALNLAVAPLYSVVLAADRVRVQAITTVILGMGNLLLAILLTGPAGWGIYGAAAAGAIMLTGRNLIFAPIYSARVLTRRLGTFYRGLLPVFSGFILTAALSTIVANHFQPDSWLTLALAAAPVSLAFGALAYLALLRTEERRMLHDMISGLAKRFRPQPLP